jgi:hypothetical protein
MHVGRAVLTIALLHLEHSSTCFGFATGRRSGLLHTSRVNHSSSTIMSGQDGPLWLQHVQRNLDAHAADPTHTYMQLATASRGGGASCR